MASSENKGFGSPDETREMDKGRLEIVEVAGSKVARATFQPGWRWSEVVKPMVGGDSCQQTHFGYCLSGSLHVAPEGGEEFDISPGDAYLIGPGHDAWVAGDEPYVGLEFSGRTIETYGQPTG